MKQVDVLIVGAGHNGLIAANYLARKGLKVVIAESGDHCGGASVSQKVFPEFEAYLSRYSYLISLLPQQIIDELGLEFETIPRAISSFTPFVEEGLSDDGTLIHKGLLVESSQGVGPSLVREKNVENFNSVFKDSHEFHQWESFYGDVAHFAQKIAPTLLEKMPSRSELKALIDHPIWDELIENPLGKTLEARFENDLLRGIVLTDGLIGTFADAYDFSANICFIYHLMGNGTGEWRVPRGGMGNLVTQLEAQALHYGAEILLGHRASAITPKSSDSDLIRVTFENGEVIAAQHLLFAAAPQILHQLLDSPSQPVKSLDGSQMKINMLVKKLPRLKSGADPREAFAGTFHINESYTQLQNAFKQSSLGEIPEEVPGEIYCHTLSDSSILSPQLQEAGYHTLTLFVLHTPASLFDREHDTVKAEVLKRVLNGFNSYLLDPIEECLARNSDGSFAIEAKTPQELEREISLPRGNIFHKDLSWPFREDDEKPVWGVETQFDGVYVIGAGARRGGGVSGIPGRNGASAIAEKLGFTL